MGFLPTEKTIYARTAKDYIMMVFGPPGVGKTTFVNDFGNVLIISTDRGTRFMAAKRIECLTWAKCLKTVDALEKPNAPKYDFICIDHADDFADMAEEATCKELQVASLSDADFGKGWKAFKNKIKGFTRRILRLGTGVVFIAHEDVKEIKTRALKLNRTMPMLPKTAWKAIIPIADVVAYAGYRAIEVPGKKNRKEVRTIETEPREDLYAKDRTKRQKPKKGYAMLDGEEFLKTFDSSLTKDEDHGEEEHSGQKGRVGRRGRRARTD